MNNRLAVLFAMSLLFLSRVNSTHAEQIQVNYTGTITTVTGSPFGLSPALSTPVSGFFLYDTTTPDSLPGDPVRGLYEHTSGGGFLLNFDSTTIEGSATPVVIVNDDLAGVVDEFRFRDGQGSGTMQLDGAPNSQLELDFVITDGTLASVSSDALPLVFSFAPSLPHTFRIQDTSAPGGTILIQFSTVTSQVLVPEPTSLTIAIVQGVLVLTGLGLYRRKKKSA